MLHHLKQQSVKSDFHWESHGRLSVQIVALLENNGQWSKYWSFVA